MRLLAVDPGETTGWAVWSEDYGFDIFGQLNSEAHHAELYHLIENTEPDVIICEDFNQHTANPAALLVSIEYIGTCKTFCSITGTRLVIQGAAIKKWSTNEKLVMARVSHKNWYKERHAVDAERHILYFLCHNPYVDPALRDATLRSLH